MGKEGTLKRLCTGFFYGIFMHGVGTVVTSIKKLSVLMLCAPNDCQQPFCKWWTSSISRFVCFLVKKTRTQKSVLNMASSNSQIDTPQRG